MKAMNVDSQELPGGVIQHLDGIYRSEDHDGTTECSSVAPSIPKEAIADENDELPAAASCAIEGLE